MAKGSFYLTVPAERWGGGYRLNTPKCTKKQASCGPSEVQLKLTLDLPDALFRQPQLSASIKIEDADIPDEVTAETINTIENIVRGEGIELTIVNPETDGDG